MKALLAAIVLCTWIYDATPPRYLEGKLPQDPVHSRDGGIALIEAHISAQGTVSDLVEITERSPFAATLRTAVSSWKFAPAIGENSRPMQESILIAGIFRAPVLVDVIPPLRATPGIEQASTNVAHPLVVVAPAYPPKALSQGFVLVELDIDANGELTSRRVTRSSGGFEEVSLECLESWRFKPAVRDGKPVTSRAYVIFSFRPPITTRKPNP